MKKKFWVYTLAMSFILPFCQTTSVLASNEIKVTINNEAVSFDVPPQTINGRTMVPMRAIFEKLGASVEWEGTTKTIIGTKGTSTIKMVIGSNNMSVNGVYTSLDSPATTINGLTLVPVRAIAESLDCDVKWDNATKTVVINTDEIENKYTSLEGDWVRVSCNKYYGSTMNIIKYGNEEKYQGTLTNLSLKILDEGKFSVGDIKMASIVPVVKNTFTGDSLSNNGDRTSYQITVNDTFTVMEMKVTEKYYTELSGDYQKWIRVSENTDIEMMQKISDTLFYTAHPDGYPIGFSKDLKNDSGQIIYTKEKANKVLDDYFKNSLERRVAVEDRNKIDRELNACEKQITIYEKELGKKNIQPNEKNEILAKIETEKTYIAELNSKRAEKQNEISRLLQAENTSTKKYNELINWYENSYY